MSLILNSTTSPQWNIYDDGPAEDVHNAELLDRYLAIMETNRKSSRFIPNDALMALDMAGFVRGQIDNSRHAQPVSVARLALALVHSQTQAPMQ